MLLEVLTYRGYTWRLTRDGINRLLTAWTPGLVALHQELTDGAHNVVALAHEKWLRAHDIRQRIVRQEPGLIVRSTDSVPWTIHEIEDEAAYQTALIAFRAAARFAL